MMDISTTWGKYTDRKQFEKEKNSLLLVRAPLFLEMAMEVDRELNTLPNPVDYEGICSSCPSDKLLELSAAYTAHYLKCIALIPYSSLDLDGHFWRYNEFGADLSFKDERLEYCMYVSNCANAEYKEYMQLSADESVLLTMNKSDSLLLERVYDWMFQELSLEVQYATVLNREEIGRLPKKADCIIRYCDIFGGENAEKRIEFCSSVYDMAKSECGRRGAELDKWFQTACEKVWDDVDSLIMNASKTTEFIELFNSYEKACEQLNYFEKNCWRCKEISELLSVIHEAHNPKKTADLEWMEKRIAVLEDVGEDYRSLLRAVSGNQISSMDYKTVDQCLKDCRRLSGYLTLCKMLPEGAQAILMCMGIENKLEDRLERLKPYYDEVTNAPGGYIPKKFKERAPEKLEEFARLMKKRNKYIGGTEKPLWFLLLGIVMLVSGIVFCKEMMQGGEYWGIAGLYSPEGIGLQYPAFLLWVVSLFLYLDIFNLLGILIVAHLAIPLMFVFEKLPFLHFVWPIVGLILFGLSVWSIWQDVMWNIYYNKTEKYYKTNILPIEDEIWKEVEEKYGTLANPSDRKSIKDRY